MHTSPAVSLAHKNALKHTQSHAGTPLALLGHRVSVEKDRPKFPEGTPAAYKELVAACWQHDADKRCVCVCVFAVCVRIFAGIAAGCLVIWR